MPIFRSIGFGIFIAIMGLMLPEVLFEGKETAISFLRGARVSADVASGIAASAALASPTTAGTTASHSSPTTLPQFSLPRTPSIPNY